LLNDSFTIRFSLDGQELNTGLQIKQTPPGGLRSCATNFRAFPATFLPSGQFSQISCCWQR
jgi:hypothetical protein